MYTVYTDLPLLMLLILFLRRGREVPFSLERAFFEGRCCPQINWSSRVAVSVCLCAACFTTKHFRLQKYQKCVCVCVCLIYRILTLQYFFILKNP